MIIKEMLRHGTDTYCYLDQEKKTSHPPLVFKTFSTREILTVIRSLQNKNSFGYDEISTKLLKISAKYICSPLTYICNRCVDWTFSRETKILNHKTII